MSDTIRNEIIALERSYWDAMKAKDGKRTANLSGEASLVTGARGVTRIPKDKMGKMTEDGSWALNSYEFDDIEIACPAPNVAICIRMAATMRLLIARLRCRTAGSMRRGLIFWTRW